MNIKKLIFQYKKTVDGKDKTKFEIWFYPIRTLIIAGIIVAGFIIWKSMQ